MSVANADADNSDAIGSGGVVRDSRFLSLIIGAAAGQTDAYVTMAEQTPLTGSPPTPRNS